MKKLLLLLALTVITLTSCEKEEADKKTTYTLVLNMDIDTDIDLMTNEYLGRETVDNKTQNACIEGKRYTFEANPNAEKVAVRISIDAIKLTRWVAKVIYLNKNEDVLIEINDDTMVQKSEPDVE